MTQFGITSVGYPHTRILAVADAPFLPEEVIGVLPSAFNWKGVYPHEPCLLK